MPTVRARDPVSEYCVKGVSVEETVINRPPGSVRVPPLLVLSVPIPLAVGVKVKVMALVDPAGKVRVVGEKVPATVLSGVIEMSWDLLDPVPGMMV